MQVARGSDPLEDAAAVAAVRAAVGPSARLRADANRRWTLQQAIAFGRAAEASGLEARPAGAVHANEQAQEEVVVCGAQHDTLPGK